MLQQQKQFAPSLPIGLLQTREIRMEVVFGTPSQNCIGSGVCMVMNHLPLHWQLSCPHAPAWVSYEKGQLRFRFSKSETLREDAVSRLESPWFLVQESFQVSRYAARRLGLHSPWIPPGLYPVEESADYWVLCFKPYQ